MRDSLKSGVLIFFLALLAPATVQLFSERAAISTAEKRALEPLPLWPARLRDWRTFPSDLDRFVRDHFGLREPLAAGWGLARYALRYTPRVAVGREGWLYFPQYWRSKYGVAGCGPLAGEVRALAGRLDRLAASAARSGVAVLLAIAPDKETVYPEYMPADSGAAGCDLYPELIGAIQRTKTVDLRAALGAWKAQEQVYFKTDSHWNDIGGWRAARLLLEGACAPGEVCARLPEPRLTTKTLGGDLAGLIGLASVLTERYVAVEVPDGKHTGRRLVVVGDSFAKSIVRFIAADESVAEAAFVDHAEGRVELAPILASKPDAILIVIVERYLYDRELLRSLAAGY
jgi:alginate O-acetyltransferase complex protein AlgJ